MVVAADSLQRGMRSGDEVSGTPTALRSANVLSMSYLEVRRATGAFGLIRQLQIEVDGAAVLSLARRSTGRVEVAEGRHTIVARMNWAYSPPFEVICADTETVRVEVIALPPEATEWKVPFVWFRWRPGLMLKVRLVD